MQIELRQFIDQTRFCRGAVECVARMLPEDDAQLDALLAEVVEENDQMAFNYVVMAALSRDRPVEAKHLAFGAMLFPFHQWLGPAAWRMRGNVPEYLLAAIQNTKLTPLTEAVSLFLAAVWCHERREGVLPTEITTAARLLARRQKLDTEMLALLLALALQAKDSGLNAILRKTLPRATDEGWKDIEEKAQNLASKWAESWRNPILNLINEKPNNELAKGTTMRRAVARLGRNEPCRCGSGKKYKNCCLGKDHDRLHHSSGVAGRTREELHANPELYLTAARMDKMGPAEMARLDPAKIPEPLQKNYIWRLCAFNLLDHAVEAFEKIGYSDQKIIYWEKVVLFTTRAGRKDLVRRMINIRANPVEVEENIHLGSALLLNDDNPDKMFQIIEDCAIEVVKSEDPEDLSGFSYGLLFSQFRALGILVARGTLPVIPPKEASELFEEILKTRDRLNLPPDDLFGEILDQRFADHGEDDEKNDSAQLRKARQNLEAKAQEVRQLKESLAQLQKEISRREKKSTVPNAAAIVAPAGNEAALRELRNKVESLKDALKERHHERNELRRELQKTSTDLEALRQTEKETASEEADAPDREDELLLPQDAPEVHPVRLVEFPKNFQPTLAAFPRHVARAAMIMIGRLAAGEPAAFVGALRLKVMPNIMRQRIGSDYRLLFRLHSDHLQVIDLINRKDLDRRLKTLI